MSLESPFSRATKLAILKDYFDDAGRLTAANAWQHVYKLLLWLDERTKLAHIYDANHMQPKRTFHKRAVRFTELLCRELGVDQRRLGNVLDVLFKGCITELLRQESLSAADGEAAVAKLVAQDVDALDDDSLLISNIAELLQDQLTDPARALPLAREVEKRVFRFISLSNMRKNALGEGVEDLLELLLQRVCGIPNARIRVRTPISQLPGFRPVASTRGRVREREPIPDLAIVDDNVTYMIITAKWSMRQDRETQFASEYRSYQKNKVQPADLRFVLVTNEFDLARLDNVAKAKPDGAGGYIFHTIYHINPALLREAHGDKMQSERGRKVGGWIDTGTIDSLENFLIALRDTYGSGATTTRQRRTRR